MSNSLEERIIKLETIVMHLQHDIEQLNAATLAQQKEIKSLKQYIERLQSRLDQADDDPEARDLREERPPHY